MSAKYVTRENSSPSKEIVLVGELVEVIVKKQDKTKRSESTPIKPTSNTAGQKASAEKKKSTPISTETPRNWGHIFGKQNLLYMKQTQSKSTKHTENKDAKRNTNVQELQKNRCNYNSKQPDATRSKRIFSQKKTEDHFKPRACRKPSPSSTNSVQSVLVQDRAVQVPETSNGSYKFGEFNPVRALRFLIKELEDLSVKDKKTNEIFNEIQQILCRIPVDSSPRKSLLGELDIISMQSKLEDSQVKLQEYTKQMKAKCESWMLERETLLSQIQELDARLREADHKQAGLENQVKVLTHQLEVTRTTEGKDEAVSTLKQQIKDDEKVMSELRTELAKQTKLARERHIKNQYMIIEKEKLSVLSSYKDTLNVELRNTIKEFQNNIAEQLMALKKEHVNGGNVNFPMSPVDTGPACSSPNSSSSDGHGLSDISLSVVERVPQECVVLKGNASKESTQFVSLAVGESSVMPESFQKQVANDGGTAAQLHNKNDFPVPHQNANEIVRKSLHQFPRNNHDKVSDKPIVSDIEKQVQSILDDMQNRRPVDVPSPLRDCPPPDWSDSSLSSVNTATDLDIVPSTDI
ncbi:PREDICTED: uncharacterized protein LOC106742218 [Dinoponera quadriceps]|uniref:Uncharacterized protein LOC106742218 n=1 Tax=Dinoponera quadriceps TaxID=609295 RepID=A0A6P3WWG9_DINQU|nr:PREDICTED: uncharacterized protein LOC106742218 [Dinoponera quadriceps]